MISLPQRTETKSCVRETTINLVPFRKVISPYANLTATSDVRITMELPGVGRAGAIEVGTDVWSGSAAAIDGAAVGLRIRCRLSLRSRGNFARNSANAGANQSILSTHAGLEETLANGVASSGTLACKSHPVI